MESQNLEEVRPSFVARFGKILFRGLVLIFGYLFISFFLRVKYLML